MKAVVIRQCVGVDMSKKDFSVCFIVYTIDGKTIIKGTKKFYNTASGFKKFIEWTNKKSVSKVKMRVVVEATGVYHEQFAHFIHDNTDYYLSVELPTKTKNYAKSLNVKTKTDQVDAKILGILGVERDLREWEPISKHLRTLRQLTRHKTRLQDHKTMVNNQLHAHLHTHQPNKKITAQFKKQLKQLDKQIEDVVKLIEDAIALDCDVQERIDKVCQIKGVKMATAASIIAETGGFALFTSRAQLISFAGYDIVQRESGSSVKGQTKISKKGNKYIRRALYMPAMTASQWEPCCQVLSQRIVERTRIPMKANVAVQRKLLVLIYTIYKKNVNFDRGYQQQQNKQDNKLVSQKV